MSYIVDKTTYFFEKLNNLQKELKTLSTEINSKSQNIPKLLKDFETKIFKEVRTDNKNINQDRVEKAYNDTIKQIHKVVQELEYKIETDRKGQEFINDNQKYLTVMIFGAVKAGKSSLGNFFAGKNLIKAPFDNPYKHVQKPIFETQESGRDTGDVTKDESGNTWFSEGVTDTTGAIQYFTLNGLRWIDSPGTGAVSKKGDTKDMTKLVEEYINYTDMCIFLMNSSEPGLQDDMKYIQKLNKDGQEALIVITKSDTVEEDEDDNGAIIQVYVPKKEDQRKLQEESICERLKEKYPDIDEKKYRAISISTLLANEAIKANDEQKFKDSNLDKLIEILCKKIDNAPTYKQRNPRRLLNNFITTVNEKIKPLEKDLNNIINQVNEYKKSLEEKINAITKKVTQKVSEIIEEKANDWNERIIRQDISSSQLQQEVMAYSYDILHKCLNKEINETISAVIDNFREQSMSVTKKDLKVKELQKETKTITDTYTVTEYYTVEKRTHGLEKAWHWVKKHWFNDTELETRSREITKTDTKVIDLGTNLDEFLDSLLPQLQEISKIESRENLYRIRDTYFAKNEKFAINMKNEIKILKDRLNSLKYADNN